MSKSGVSCHPAFMGNCLTISHTCELYLPSRWVHLLFLVLLKEIRILGESKVLLNERMMLGEFNILPFWFLILNQLKKIIMSCCKSSKTTSNSVSHLHIVLSSAKLQMFVLSTKRKRSLINKLHNNRFKIDPCSMPLIVIPITIPWIYFRALSSIW